jgi:hypothetical protein
MPRVNVIRFPSGVQFGNDSASGVRVSCFRYGNFCFNTFDVSESCDAGYIQDATGRSIGVEKVIRRSQQRSSDDERDDRQSHEAEMLLLYDSIKNDMQIKLQLP